MEAMNPTFVQATATLLFGCAVLHTFLVKQIARLANRFPSGSMAENFLHFLAEIEIVFGFWAALFIAIWSWKESSEVAVQYIETMNFSEAIFVFIIMSMAATKPIMNLSRFTLFLIAKLLPIHRSLSFYGTILIVGPLLGSFITEPAAMTVSALILYDFVFRQTTHQKFRYATLALLFVNVSIGGTLTHFAAPPVLMVAAPWKWDSVFMLTHFGWKAAIATCLNTAIAAFVFRDDIRKLSCETKDEPNTALLKTAGVTFVHVLFLIAAIVYAHQSAFLIAVFLFFIGWCQVAEEYQDPLKLRESFLVAFFLAGLVVLGKQQDWWLSPIIESLSSTTIFWAATCLTAITDNAALTYLGTLVSSIPDSSKYALVSGAVTGGGLTVIANAPNPAGFGILKRSFGDDGIGPGVLFVAALPFTMIAAICFLTL